MCVADSEAFQKHYSWFHEVFRAVWGILKSLSLLRAYRRLSEPFQGASEDVQRVSEALQRIKKALQGVLESFKEVAL